MANLLKGKAKGKKQPPNLEPAVTKAEAWMMRPA
jgi:hypothetical protein